MHIVHTDQRSHFMCSIHTNIPHTGSSGLIYNESQQAQTERKRENEGKGYRDFSGPSSSQRFGDQSSPHKTNWPQASTATKPCMSFSLTHRSSWV